MLTNSNIQKRATKATGAVVWQPSERYQGAAVERAICPSSQPTNFIGGGFRQGHALRLEGLQGADRRQNQS
jgi:hypothetical protein